MTPDNDRTTKQSESLHLAGHLLPDKVKEILAQGNVRKLAIRSETGELYLSIPLTAGAIIGGAFVLAAPWLTLLASIAGLLANVQVEVTYDGPEQDENHGSREDAS